GRKRNPGRGVRSVEPVRRVACPVLAPSSGGALLLGIGLAVGCASLGDGLGQHSSLATAQSNNGRCFEVEIHMLDGRRRYGSDGKRPPGRRARWRYLRTAAAGFPRWTAGGGVVPGLG